MAALTTSESRPALRPSPQTVRSLADADEIACRLSPLRGALSQLEQLDDLAAVAEAGPFDGDEGPVAVETTVGHLEAG